MDAIQRTLVRAGRKDLAQKYYKKINAFSISNIQDQLKKQKPIRVSITDRSKDIYTATWKDKTVMVFKVMKFFNRDDPAKFD